MADKIKDAEDALLESLFSAEAIADDGFSDRIVRKINRRLWLRQLVLPVAAAVGGMIAFKPTLALLTLASQFQIVLPGEFVASATGWLPSPYLIVTGGMLLAAAMLGVRMLEE